MGTNATSGVYKNGVPLLLYLDTFKNFFANTQENKFYMISNVGSEPTIKAGFGGTPSVDYKLPTTGLKVTPKNTDTVSLIIPFYRDWEITKTHGVQSHLQYEIIQQETEHK